MIAAANQAGAGQAVTVKSIAEQLGHTDGGVLVLRRYGHLFKGTRRQAALAFDEYVRASDGARAADRERAETRPTAH
jgi:hypothetical protein